MPNATPNQQHLKITPLDQRGIVAVTGEDRHSFLQGLISHDVFKAEKGQALYAAYLTPQGKFLYDFFVLATDEALLLDLARDEVAEFMGRLATHKLRSKITLTDASDRWRLWAAWGAEISSPTAGPYKDTRHPDAGWRFLLPAHEQPSIGTIVPYSDYNYHRLELGLPDAAQDMDKGKSTLLEGNFDRINGISWNKGCYIGQELTARMKYRGLVKRRLYPVHLSGLPDNMRIMKNNQEIGELRSYQGDCGLALLDSSILGTDRSPLLAGNCVMTVRDTMDQTS